MKTIGLIGGMSWESSAEYYRLINEGVKARLGGLHSAKCVMVSVDFAEIEALQHQERWDQATALMVDAARSVEQAGAEFLVICTNTMHRMADDVQRAIAIPLLHIADATAERVLGRGIGTVGLLGTRYTMEQDFYKGRLAEKHGLKVLVPDTEQRELVNRVIYGELVLGDIRDSSRRAFEHVMESLVERGAQGIILGCTEIGLLIHDDDVAVPLFDTAKIHAEAAVAYALGG